MSDSRPLPFEMARALRARIAGPGHPPLATFLKLPATEAVELVARAGFDVVIVDLEHSQLSEGEARRLVTHAAAIGLPAVVRIPTVDAGLVNRLLEAGAAGIQLSMVRCRDQVDALLGAVRYPPEGVRSINTAHVAAGFGEMTIDEYLARVGVDGPLVIAQIETATTEDPLEVLVVGLDVAFCGTTDLSVSLGEPGALDGDAVRGRVQQVADAAERAGTVMGGFAATADGVASLVGMGARYLAFGADLGFLGGALRAARSDATSVLGR